MSSVVHKGHTYPDWEEAHSVSLATEDIAALGYVTSNSVSVMIAAAGPGSGVSSASASVMIAAQIAEIDKVGSASLATALQPYLTSASAASQYVTSNSVSVMIAAAPGGSPGAVLLGSVSTATTTITRFSGSWSDYAVLIYTVDYITAGTSNTASVGISTDGGTSQFLSVNIGTASTASSYRISCQIANGQGRKAIQATKYNAALVVHGYTATANTGFINAVQLTHGGTSNTMAICSATLFGLKR
jgi:hypothetical protein